MSFIGSQIRPQAEFGLHGAFKVDIYNQAGEMVETTDYFDNFITETGLNYPYWYNFADCFRYLSLGDDGSANTLNTEYLHGSATVALVKDHNNGNKYWQYWTGLGDSILDKASNASAGSCGTIVEAAGPAWYRGWVLPTGDNTFTESNVPIQEFMVSPSSGTDPTGRLAFSRIPRSVSIPSGTRTIITYRLQVKIKHTGINYFYKNTFNTGGAEVSEQVHLVSGWGQLSGYYRQCYHGLRCVDNQGRTFIPKYGDPMEPSQVKMDSLAIYFSPENSQFDVSKFGGAQENADSANEIYRAKAEKDAYQTDGLAGLSFNHNLQVNAGVPDNQIHNNAKMAVSAYPDDSDSPFKLPKDIRLKPTSDERPPKLSDYSSVSTQSVDLNESNYDYLTEGTDGSLAVSMASFGEQGIRTQEFDRGFLAGHSSMMSNVGINFAEFTGRRRRITRKAFITPINALGHNSRFASLVYAFKNGSTYYPSVDCMFFDTTGRSVMQHYRKFNTVYLSDRGRGIIDCTLTTNPKTSGPFSVKTIQGPIVYDPELNPGPPSSDVKSEKLESDITGYSGFFIATEITQNNEYGYPETTTVPAIAMRVSGPDHLNVGVTPGYTAPGDLGPKSTESYKAEGYWYDGMVGVDSANPDSRPYYGIGAIYAHKTPQTASIPDADAQDFGVVEHRIEVQSPVPVGHPEYDANDPEKLIVVRERIPEIGKYPDVTDQLYWPNVHVGHLDFATENLTYYEPGLGLTPDPEGYFQRVESSTKGQVIADITFVPTGYLGNVSASFAAANNTATEGAPHQFGENARVGAFEDTDADLTIYEGGLLPNTWKTLSSIKQNCFLCDTPNSRQWGFLLSRSTGDGTDTGGFTGEYWDGTVNSSDMSTIKTAIKDLRAGADQYKNPVTGYLVDKATYGKYIHNTTWVGGPTGSAQAGSEAALTTDNAIMFPVNLVEAEIYVGTKVASNKIKISTVNNFFDGFTKPTADHPHYQVQNMTARLSGEGHGVGAGDDLSVFFTGLISGEGGGNADPVNMMATVTTSVGDDFDGRYTCEIVPTVKMTDFAPPLGYFIHHESNRLLPNFAEGQTDSDSYPREEIDTGGVYPGMSSLNTLEVYMDISWSAPCAGVADCVEQEA